VLPVILQHVRELAEVHLGAPERARHKIITPFPPIGPDFPEFQPDDLGFRDVPPDASSASLDTLHAHEFFVRTDALYYDYSYGIRTEEFRLSHICDRFYAAAQGGGSDPGFGTSFARLRDAFQNRYDRVTSGDLGHLPFKYTSLTPVAWNDAPVVLNAAEVERLKEKTIALYQDLDPGSIAFLNDLIEGVKALNYSSVSYELGFFDVIREWMDPGLFENPHWAFPSGTRTLYGEGDPVFADNAVRLCYAQRFYLIRNTRGTRPPPAPPAPPDVRDHRIAMAPTRAAGPEVLRRRAVRNTLIHRKAERFTAIPRVALTAAASAPAPPPRAGFVWKPATATVPGHWERARAGETAPPPPAPAPAPEKPGFTIAALKCRLLAQTP
jgi:hypothetical protein